MQFPLKKFFIGLSVFALLTITGCNWGREGYDLDSGEDLGTASDKGVAITETTVGRVEECSVGVGNIWKDELDDKTEKVGATLAFNCPSSKDNGNMRVHEQQQIKVAGKWWVVAKISEGKSRRGRVILEPIVTGEDVTTSTVEQFSCSEFDDFSFSYPIFKGFEIKPSALMPKKGLCLLQFGDTYHLSVSKEYYHGVPGEMSPPEQFKLKNPQGVLYRLYSNKNDMAEFWVEDGVVKMELSGETKQTGFSQEQFWKKIIETFAIKK